MKKYFIIAICLFASLGSVSAKNKYLYWHLSGGMTGILNYQDGAAANELKNTPEIENSTAIFDLGVYTRASRSTMIGVNYNLAFDYYKTSNGSYTGEYTEFHSLIGLSMIHFFNGKLGSGLFGRADFGGTILSTMVTESGGHTAYFTNATSDWGLGGLAGIGYALDLGSFKLEASANYSFRSINDEKSFNHLRETHIVGLSLGVMW